MQQNFCPICGRPLTERGAARLAFSGWEQVKTTDFAATARWPFATTANAAAWPAGATWERRAPVRKADLAADVLTPAAQSAITALVGAVAGGLLTRDLAGAGLGAAITFSATWLTLLKAHRAALWAVERVTGADLDGDGAVGRPSASEPAPATVRVELKEEKRNAERWRWLDLPVSDEKLTRVARAVLEQGVAFSRRGLADVLTQNEYEKLAAAMLAGGLLVDLPGNKRELTAAGRALLRQMTR